MCRVTLSGSSDTASFGANFKNEPPESTTDGRSTGSCAHLNSLTLLPLYIGQAPKIHSVYPDMGVTHFGRLYLGVDGLVKDRSDLIDNLIYFLTFNNLKVFKIFRLLINFGIAIGVAYLLESCQT
jgi:hypothetical protein